MEKEKKTVFFFSDRIGKNVKKFILYIERLPIKYLTGTAGMTIFTQILGKLTTRRLTG